MMHQLEVLVTDPVLDISLSAGEEVVDDYNFVAGEHQTIDQMGADETRATRHQYSLPILVIQKLHRWKILSDSVFDRGLEMLQFALQLANANPRLLDVLDVSIGRLLLDIANFCVFDDVIPIT